VVTEERGAQESSGGEGNTSTAGGSTREQGAMDVVDQTTEKPDEVHSKDTLASHSSFILEPLSRQLQLDNLWQALSECLDMLAQTSDPHAVLILQSTVEAFFLVHANNPDETKPANKLRTAGSRSRSSGQLSLFRAGSESGDPTSPAPRMDFSPVPSTPGLAKGEDSYSHLPPDTARFLMFAEKHRTVLNQILRQSTVPVSEGPFSILVNYTKILDFDIKRRYFRHELELLDDGGLRREDIVVHLRREHVFEDAFRELYRRSPEDFKGNLYIQFEGEEGQDAGGLLREFYIIIARDMFNPNYALFTTSPGDRVTYRPNPSSHVNPNHLNYFRFIGRMIAKAIYDNKLLDCYFTRSFYKHILGKAVHYTDMESEDYSFYQGMVYLIEHNVDESGIGDDLTFSIEIREFGKMEVKDLKENGRQIAVTESNKKEYVQLACQMKMTESIKAQIKSFLEGFYEIIPKDLIAIFNEQELELLISGLPTIDIDDLKANTEYRSYQETSLQVRFQFQSRSINFQDFGNANSSST
jgi:E3 ubiquitin-protein ligase HUWE1